MVWPFKRQGQPSDEAVMALADAVKAKTRANKRMRDATILHRTLLRRLNDHELHDYIRHLQPFK